MAKYIDGTLSSPYDYELKFPKEKTLVDFLLKQASQHCKNGIGEAKWLTNTETGDSTTFSQVEPLSRSVASGLFKRGLRHRDIVLYNANHPSRLHVFILGVWRANGILRTIYPQESEDTVAEKIIESKARFFLCDELAVGVVREALKKVPWQVEIFVFGGAENCTSTEMLFQDEGESCPELQTEETDVAVILTTSGTTGPSKGASHTHAGVVKTIISFEHSVYVHDPSHPFLALVRPTHIAGLMVPFVTLLTGREILMMRNITADNILEAVHTYKPSLLFGFPSFFLCLAHAEASKKYDLSSAKIIICGGLVISPSYIKTMESIPGVSARVMAAYAMTECGGFVTAKDCSHTTADSQDDCILKGVPPFSSGKLVPGTSLQARDLTTNKCLGPNQRGELYFLSPFACVGYYNRPEETKLAFPDGWIKTGDVGYFDENGFVFVVDRSKEMFKYYSDHISPSEVEDVIRRHEAVDNVCVVGIVDPEGGDRIPRAFVTLKKPEATAQEILKFANDILPEYKQLRGGLIVLPELPMGKTGKVTREILNKVQICVPRMMET